MMFNGIFFPVREYSAFRATDLLHQLVECDDRENVNIFIVQERNVLEREMSTGVKR